MLRFGATAAVVISPVTYAVVRHANEVYAWQLGTSPEQLGATESLLIAKAMLVATVYGIIIVIAPAALTAGWMLGRMLKERAPDLVTRSSGSGAPSGQLRTPARHKEVRWWHRAIVAGFIGLGGLSFLVSGLTDGVAGVWLVAGFAGMLTGVGLLAEFSEWTGSPPARARPFWRVPGRPLLLVSVLTIVTTLGVFAWSEGLERGAEVEADHVLLGGYSDSTLARWFLVGVPVPAKVVQLTDQDPLALCDGSSATALIGADSDSLLLVVYPDSHRYPLTERQDDVFVAHAPRSGYAVVTGLQEIGVCESKEQSTGRPPTSAP